MGKTDNNPQGPEVAGEVEWRPIPFLIEQSGLQVNHFDRDDYDDSIALRRASEAISSHATSD